VPPRFLLIGNLVVLTAMAVMLFLLGGQVRHWRGKAEAVAELRLRDQAAWRDAARQATFNAVLAVHRTEAARALLNQRTAHALASDRDRAVAAYQRLRRSAEAHLGAPGNPDLSAARDATCRAVAGTGCDAIPATLKAAQDNTDQLVRLIAWVKQQGALTPSPAPGALPAETMP
jgi:hypothetical protein